MKKKKKELLLFIAIFIITILLLRFWVLIIQEKSIYILGYEIHHMFIGIFLVLLSGFSRFFSKNKVLNKIDLFTFAIGAGMIIDEVVFIIFTAGEHLDYLSFLSLGGAIGLALVLIIIFYIIFKGEQDGKI